ncbi:type II toxin-antitoxin system RelE/ParE family toxin [Dyadobacter sandarakinus]|uniref:Type II toxin-antitoxin system RelE/ParE family toxin n=1 Tax=Dyadobacter sandarakinus TaxID=2747268 RepID=A0ABX7I901_9BACT|nr:type II toxin-antitoxin system RelE/ParE family toxin [Dyadobacter sandarakinus]QRR02188.1 type II toxin-antitoxin system RelE/ParE family toxin [Dyadobacter sandarakinus]
MIKSISHKGLCMLWEKGNASKLPDAQIEELRRVLTALNTARTLEPLRAIPGYRLHSLSGTMAGMWSI